MSSWTGNLRRGADGYEYMPDWYEHGTRGRQSSFSDESDHYHYHYHTHGSRRSESRSRAAGEAKHAHWRQSSPSRYKPQYDNTTPKGRRDNAQRKRDPKPNNPNLRNRPPNHYATLEIPRDASTDEIRRAAKAKRIETHPDKRIRDDMTDQEKLQITIAAQLVGQAAEVLLDPIGRKRYDADLRAWEGIY